MAGDRLALPIRGFLMGYQSNLPTVLSQMQRGRAAGLLAAAAVVENRVKQQLAGGYTSGRFVTGHVLASVNHSEPEVAGPTGYILVGTDVMYALFWEVGHNNLFTRKHERVEVWVPALFSTRAEQLAAYQRAFRANFAGGRA
jgi:hypothetical protein